MTALGKPLVSTIAHKHTLVLIILWLNLVFTAVAEADAFLYRIENNSSVDIFAVGTTYLSGNLELGGCSNTDKAMNSERDFYTVHSIRFDRAPDELGFYLQGYSSINLFGGPGVGLDGGAGSMKAFSDGRVHFFSWFLRHALAEEHPAYASIYRRKLTIDEEHMSRLHFETDYDACPQHIELNLLIEDTWSIYQPERHVTPIGEQLVVARPVAGGQSHIVGRMTIFATKIPGSIHYFARDPIRLQKRTPPVTNQKKVFSIQPRSR